MKTALELQEILNWNMENLFEVAPCAFVITTQSGLILRANQTFYNWIGSSSEKLINNVRFQDLLSVGSKIYYETHYAPLLKMQHEVSEIALDLESVTGKVIPILINTRAIFGSKGEVLFYKSTLFNISERRKYENELRVARVKAEKETIRIELLLKSGEELRKSENFKDNVQAVASLAVDKFCDAFAIDLIAQNHMQRLGEASATPHKSVPPLVMREEFKEPILVEDFESQAPGYLSDMFSALEPQSLLVVPVLNHGRPVGIVSALLTELGRRFNNEDLTVLIDLAQRISSALDLYQLQSENEKAFEEIVQMKGWFESTLKFLGDAVIGLRPDGKVTFINGTAENLTGWKSEEIEGKLLSQVMSDFGSENLSIEKITEQVLTSKISSPLYKKHYLRTKNGEKIMIENRTSPIIDQSGKVLGVVIIFRDVSKEHFQNKRLVEERSRFEAVLQQMPEGVLIADPSGKVILKNAQLDLLRDAYAKTDLLIEFNKLIGLRPSGEKYRPHEWPLARSLKNGEIVMNEEITFRKNSGEHVTLSVSSAPIKGEDGSVVAGVLILHDISKAKLIESDLRYQLNLTKVITDNAVSGLFMMDKEGKPTYMNPAAKKIIGYDSLEEISGKPLHYSVHWKKPDGTQYPMEECPIDNAQATLQKIQNQEEVFCTKDGKFFPVSYSVSPLQKDGETVGSLLEFRDITDQKEIEKKLNDAIGDRDKALQTLTIINTVGQRITAELDLEKLVQQVTDDATKLTGAQFGTFFYNSVDTEGRSVLLNVVSGVPKESFQNFPNLRSTYIFQSTFSGARTVRSADIIKDLRFGNNYPYYGLPKEHVPVRSYLAVSVTSRTGEFIGGLFFGHELPGVFTEQAEKIAEGLAAQAAVAMDNARLYGSVQESVRARDEFLSIVSHELKTPLTSLKLQTQIRARKLAKGDLNSFGPPGLKKMFETDGRQIERLSRLIDDMLDISRINTGKLTLQLETFDLCELVNDVIERFSSQMQDSGTDMSFVCFTPAVGFWDRFRIEQIIINLLTNALRYGNKQPVEVSVSIESGNAIISVKDSGIGIAKENLNRIFERFERAISSNEISGLGLGLYIVRQIVEMHQGSIDVESEFGRGSTFIVKLPLKRDE